MSTVKPFVLVAALAVLSLSPGAAALTGPIVAKGPEFVVNQNLSFQQEWAKVAMDPEGTRFAVGWNSDLTFKDVWVRFFNIDGSAATNEIQVNTWVTSGNQDDPMIAMDEFGNTLVCWGDRDGHDGFLIGCFGRVFDSEGTPLGPEFQINQSGAAASQWEPMPSAMPGGGWVVAFNGELDGDSYLRYLAIDGTPLTGDVLVNVSTNNAQTEAECAVMPTGRVLAVYADFSSAPMAGSGTNLFGRLFNASGVPLDVPFLINENTLPNNQLEPRIAASGLGFGLGNYVIVWEDWGIDGSGSGIMARIYDADGVPLADEFAVNTTTTGNQILPEVACDHVGNFIVTWEDLSTGTSRILARRYDRYGAALSGELVISGGAGAYRRPMVAMDQSGEEIVFSYSGPGTHEDVYVRQYTFAPVTVSGPAALGTTFDIDVDLPGGEGDTYAILGAYGTTVGLPLPDGRTLQLDVDPFLSLSLFFPNTFPFANLQGVLDASTQATGSMTLPNNPNLIGLELNWAAVVFDLTYGALVFQLRHVTKPVSVTIE